MRLRKRYPKFADRSRVPFSKGGTAARVERKELVLRPHKLDPQ
jgi:hypothetical protein